MSEPAAAALTADEVLTRITQRLEGLDILEAAGDHYIYYDPDRSLPQDKRFPFATIIVSDAHDRASDLNREGVYRLNVGIERDHYRRRFGELPKGYGDEDGLDLGVDYRALDRLLPHPVYAAMAWVCVLCPSRETFEQTMIPLLEEAHGMAARAHRKRSATGR